MALTTAEYGTLVDLIGAAGLVVLGAWVLRFKPRRRATIAFGASFGLYGLEYVLSNSLSLAHAPSAGAVLAYMALDAASVMGLVLLVLWYPRPIRLSDRPARIALAGASGLTLLLIASMVAYAGDFAATIWDIPGLSEADRAIVVPAAAVWLPVAVLGVGFVTLILPFRFRIVDDDADRRAIGLVALANAILSTGLGKDFPDLASSNAFDALAPVQGALVVGISVVLWLRNAAAGPSARLARDVALTSLGAMLAGLLYVTLLPGAEGEGINGLSRVAAAVVLAYAILRRQLLGLDVTVKWTIRQSTLAGIFIAVFFAVSEGTQALVSESAGPFVGIAAAGMLLFAMAPLQRAAERVASAAMPGVRPVSDMSHVEHLQLYREQAAILWSDGTLDREERHALANLRQRLGISPEEAERVDLEVAPR